MYSYLHNYQKEVKKKLKLQRESVVEDVDKTLRLEGELKAINKILNKVKGELVKEETVYESSYGIKQF